MASSATGPVKRSVRIAGHPTSISLEPVFWEELKRIAAIQRIAVNSLITHVDMRRTGNLSSALRVFVLEWMRSERQARDRTRA